VHGTSAHVGHKDGQLTIFSGGVSHELFSALFDKDKLLAGLANIGGEVMVFGEAYGGKCQGMSHIYGKDLRFVAFDVKIGDSWLAVPAAHEVVTRLGLEFVHYEKGPTDLAWLDAQRDAPSVQAVRNGMGEGHAREGVVIRPLVEMRLNNGERVIVKHKGDHFKETATPRKVDSGKLEVLAEADKVAMEWVTKQRLENAKSHFEEGQWCLEKLGSIIRYIVKDVEREAEGEVVFGSEARRSVGKRVAHLLKQEWSSL